MGVKAEYLLRKLNLIEEDIKSKRFEDALRKTGVLLKDYPNVIPAIVIKADLLLTLEMSKERALESCLKAKTLILAEDAPLVDQDYIKTLNTLKSVCKYLNRWDIIIQCYDFAYKKSADIAILETVFECHVREFSFRNQRKVALTMYNASKNEKHLLWVICSIQLQVFGSKVPDKLLAVAEELFVEHEKSYQLRSPGSFQIYISVLEQRRKYKDALIILSRMISENRVREIDALRMKGKLLALDSNYAEAAEVFEKLLTKCPDDWECFLHYLSSLLEDDSMWSCGTNNDQIHPPKLVDRKLSHLSDDVFDLRMSTASAFVRSLIPALDMNDIIRCPHWALLEIERKCFLQGKSNGETLIGLLLDYSLRFGQLACFTSDVERFLQVLTTDEAKAFVKRFKLVAPPDGKLSMLTHKVTLFKLQELFELSLGELENNAVDMTELFIKTNLDFQENMFGVELLSMASNVLVQLFWRTQRLGYLLEAIFILEFGLTFRRSIPQYKILLVHLYSHLGAFKLAYEWYKSLGIEKNLLLETISHHILPQMLSSPFLGYSTNLLEEYLNFMNDQFVESADYAIDSYTKWLFSDIFGHYLLRDRLQHSLKYLMARLETPILQLKEKAENIEDVEHVLQSLDYGSQLQHLSSKKNLKSLRVNDDMQTRPWWNPTPDVNYLLELIEKLFIHPHHEDKNWLWRQEPSKKVAVIKRKSLLPRLISEAIMSASSFLKQGAEASSSTSDSNPSIFLNLLVDYAGNLGFSFSEAENMVRRMSTGETTSTFQELSSSDIVDWMNFAVFLTAQKLGSHGYWNLVDSLFRNLTEERITSDEHLIQSPGPFLSFFVQMITEPISWHCLVLQSCTRLLVPTRKKKKKGKSAGKLTQPQKMKGKHAEQLTKAVVSSIESLSGTIELVIERLRVLKIQLEEQSFDTVLSLLPNNDACEGSPTEPGRVFAILRNLSSSLGSSDVYGDGIHDALRSWDAAVVVRKVKESLEATLSEFLKLCQLKLTLLKGLKKQFK